jgi:Zn-finger nucleic acid-binding protein
MICSFCDAKMLALEREGIEIHYCPQCGGTWLRRGALEGIIARMSRSSRQRADWDRGRERNNHDEDDDDASPPWDGRSGRGERREQRRGGLRGILGDLFDFG